MPNYYEDPALQQAQIEAQHAATTASNYQTAASLLPQKLKDAVNAKLDYNKDIIDQQAKAQAEYFKAPSAAREQYQDIWNPFEREKLVAGERAQAYQPYASLSGILGQRMGTIADIIGAGTGAFNASVSAQQGNAQLARQKYADLLNMAQLQEGRQQQQWENDLTLQKLLGTGGGSGLGGGGGVFVPDVPTTYNSPTPTEPMPTYVPRRTNVEYHSPQGQWIWSPEYKQWAMEVF